ncbi:MAG: galactose ABC transporter substrate-binding protein [Pygmaiobacter massiliensis]|nr:galactose ABC transporter substrate-binding protein [Pygmaiobacter massiliensis]
MKKVIALALTAVLALSLVACGGSASSAPAASAPASSAAGSVASTTAKGGKVGVCIYKFDDNFMTLYREELDKYLSDMGYDVTVVDGKNDQATQTEQVNTFITQGVDCLVVNLVQASAAPTVIEAAKAADIPVVFINREPTAEDLASYEKACYVGADARQSGTFQGEIIAETENKGDFNGNGTVDYIMIMGDPENVDAQYRTEFSIKALTDAGLKVNKLFEQRGDWDQAKGQELAATALTQYGDKIDVIFCNNDAMALGAAQAITAARRTVGKDIYLVGVDALEEAKAMVDAGTMTGTVLNDHIGQAHTAGDCVKTFIDGGLNKDDGDQNYTVDYVKVVK